MINICEECLQNPCSHNCPNFKPKIISSCIWCKNILYEGDDIIKDNDENYFCDDVCYLNYMKSEGYISSVY